MYYSGMVAALTNESATSKSVYFAHCTSEMIFITHLLTEEPEKLAGPLLADTYVTLLKGRNAWYGQMLAKGELSPDMGDSIKGKGMIQVSCLIFSCHCAWELKFCVHDCICMNDLSILVWLLESFRYLWRKSEIHYYTLLTVDFLTAGCLCSWCILRAS